MFNVIKCYKVNKNTLYKVSNHTHRTKLTDSENARINNEKTAQNRILVGSNVSADVRNRIKNFSTNKTRKDAVFCEQYVISASPEFFTKHPEKLQAWIDSQIEFLKDEFGPNLTTAVLHLDETTPHVEAFVTPIIKNAKTGKMELNRKAFNNDRGGLNSFKLLQDRHAEHNKKFDLNRGILKEKTKIEAIELNDYYKTVKEYQKKLSGYKPPQINDLMPGKSWGMYKMEDIKAALKKALNVNSKVFKKAIAAVEFYKKRNIKLTKEINIVRYNKDLAVKKINELKEEIKNKDELNEQLKPLINLGEKVVDLGLVGDIEDQYDKKLANESMIAEHVPEQPEQESDRVENDQTNGIKSDKKKLKI